MEVPLARKRIAGPTDFRCDSRRQLHVIESSGDPIVVDGQAQQTSRGVEFEIVEVAGPNADAVEIGRDGSFELFLDFCQNALDAGDGA